GLQWLARRCSTRSTPVTRHRVSTRCTFCLNNPHRGEGADLFEAGADVVDGGDGRVLAGFEPQCHAGLVRRPDFPVDTATVAFGALPVARFSALVRVTGFLGVIVSR